MEPTPPAVEVQSCNHWNAREGTARILRYLIPCESGNLPQWLSSKESTCSTGDSGDMGSTPGSGRQLGGDGNPPQKSYLENPMDGGDWRAAVHGVAKSQTRLSD